MKKHTFQDLLTKINTHVAEPIRGPLSAFLAHKEVRPRLENAPASSAVRYHHAYEGGLIDHIMDVGQKAMQLAPGLFGPPVDSSLPRLSASDIWTVAALHDIHKIGDASEAMAYEPNNSVKTGKRSEAEPFKKCASCYSWLPMAKPPVSLEGPTDRMLREIHLLAEEASDVLPGGVLSMALVHAYSPELYALLSPEVRFAIRYHDGAYQPGANFKMGGKESALQIIFHCADMLSSRERNWTNPA